MDELPPGPFELMRPVPELQAMKRRGVASEMAWLMVFASIGQVVSKFEAKSESVPRPGRTPDAGYQPSAV
jgi:hypothetical protein